MLHVLVADGKWVRVFESASDGGLLRELATFQNAQAAPHEQDLTADRSGRMFNAAAGVTQTYEPKVSARRQSTRRWLKSLGPQIQTLLAAERSEGLVLVAAARTLAELRASLPPRARALIGVELARDLTKQPLEALSRRLQPSLRELRRSKAVLRPRVMRFARPAAPPG